MLYEPRRRTTEVRSPKSARILVFTTCYNERDNIGPLIDDIATELPLADILIVDDNSPDGTWDVIRQKTTKYKQLTAVQRPRKMGIGGAHKYALFFAMREGYQTLITMDADFSHDPKHLTELLRAHAKNRFVTGSRYCKGGKSDYGGYRNVVSRIGNLAARWALGLDLHDFTTFYRVFDVASLRHVPLRRVIAEGYSYGVQLVFYLGRAGIDLREVPIHFPDRTRGPSKIPRLQILFSAIDLFKLAAVRFFRCGYFEADLFVDDACAKCGDRVLAMKTRREHATESELTYTCLRCGTCCKL